MTQNWILNDQILANNETPTMDVEPRYFAGAVALLQESGQMAQVGSQSVSPFSGERGGCGGCGIGNALAEQQSRIECL